MNIVTEYPKEHIRTGTFQYKGEVYHVDSDGNVYQWNSHDDIGGFFSKIGNVVKKAVTQVSKVAKKVNAAPLQVVQKVASLTPLTKKLAENDILLKIEAKRVEFENKHIYDPAQAKKDIKKVAPYVAVAVATYFGFGSVASAALSAYNARKQKLEQQKAQAAADREAQGLIDQQIAQVDAEIARLNGQSATATADQKRMDELVAQWNKYNEMLATDKSEVNAKYYNTQMTAIENEMLALSNKAKQLPSVTMPDPNPAPVAIKPAPVVVSGPVVAGPANIVAEQVTGWSAVPLTSSTVKPEATFAPVFSLPANTVAQPSPSFPVQSNLTTPMPSPAPFPVQTSPYATDAVAAFFNRQGTETGPGIVDVSKPDPGTPAATATDASKWIKPLLIGGAALISLAN